MREKQAPCPICGADARLVGGIIFCAQAHTPEQVEEYERRKAQVYVEDEPK